MTSGAVWSRELFRASVGWTPTSAPTLSITSFTGENLGVCASIREVIGL